MKKLNRAQSVAEYLILMSVILAAAITVGMLGRMKGSFETYFNAAKNTIVSPSE